MHFHYYLLERLAKELPLGEQVCACFSQGKNELILEWDSYYLRIGCHTPLTYIIPVHNFARARKNVVNLFPEILGKRLLSIEAIKYERILIFHFEEACDLVVKLHGARANVMAYHQGQWIESFNQNRKEPATLDFSPGPFYSSALPETCSQEEILPLLKSISPIFEKKFATRIYRKMKEGLTLPLAFEWVKKEAQAPPYYLSKESKGIQFFLFEPPQSAQSLSFPDAQSALKQFLSLHFQFSNYQRQYKALSKVLGDPFKKQKKALNSYTRSVDRLQQERSPEELGHILMANLHRVEPGQKEIECEDYYQGGTIRIKLNPKLSPQDNAQRYYTKYKDQKSRLKYLETELSKIQESYRKAKADWERLQELPIPDKLAFGPTGFDRAAIQRIKELTKREVPKAPLRIAPFRRFEHMGYEVFVGKNGKNNDELSFKFAAKEDIWLHAKDVAGSHVIIRQKAGRDLPGPVLEFAASLAAYFSKSKNDTVVPVIYTPRKYVRKRKGDPPGKVVLNREDVILVEPLRKEEVRA